MPIGKMRWGDTLDDEDILPPTTVKGPDDHGLKTIIEYYRNDKGDAFKKTTKVKIVTVEKKVYKAAELRRQLPRFGSAAKETVQDSVTMRGTEEIPFERVRQLKATQGEKKEARDIQQALASADKQVISGSLKDILYRKRMEREMLRAQGKLSAAEKPPGEDEPPPSSLGPAQKGSYVPPSRRGGAGGTAYEGDSMHKRREDNSVRVTNLSEEVTEADLQQLFTPFGQVTRVFLAIDRTTGGHRGFAFVNYAHREDADRAIATLNGFGYDNLILRVEYAAPRAER